jgi:hypothetical protein
MGHVLISGLIYLLLIGMHRPYWMEVGGVPGDTMYHGLHLSQRREALMTEERANVHLLHI